MSASRGRADRTEPHWFGVPPPLGLLLLATACFAIAVALFATSHWPYALIVLGLAALFAAGFLEQARRRPLSRRGRSAARSAVRARERAAAALERVLARSAAAGDAQRARNAQAVLAAERRAALLMLGEAVHRDDEPAARAARERLADLDRTEEGLRRGLAERLARAEDRIRRSRLSVRETAVVEPEGTSRPGA